MLALPEILLCRIMLFKLILTETEKMKVLVSGNWYLCKQMLSATPIFLPPSLLLFLLLSSKRNFVLTEDTILYALCNELHFHFAFVLLNRSDQVSLTRMYLFTTHAFIISIIVCIVYVIPR